MKYLSFINYLFFFFIITACSSNEEPDYTVLMQPSTIITTDANGYNQTFKYDEYGRIVTWNLKSNRTDRQTSYTSQFFYPDDNTIKVKSEELLNGQKRCFEETIQLVNGRATNSEGTYISYNNGNQELSKTYRLEFNYLPSNHLNSVKHSEVIGIGEEIKNDAWDNSWNWENYLIWEDGNLKEFQDFQGNSSIYQTTKYEYSIYKVSYPVIIPMVINNAHHTPLVMQGYFGLNSANLVQSSSVIDRNGNLYLSHQYNYEFDRNQIIEFVETISGNLSFSNPIPYKVNWTEK